MERELIGSILAEPSNMLTALAAGVSGEHFESEHYRSLWDCALEIDQAGGIVTPRTLAERADAPEAELEQMRADVPAAGAKYYADRVMQGGADRKAVKLLKLAAFKLERGRRDEAMKLLSQASGGVGHRVQVTRIGDHVGEAMAIINGEIPLSTTGLPSVDALLAGGVAPGDTIVVAADTGMGKTSFALQWASEDARAGRRPLYLSLEMSGARMAQKAIGLLGGADTTSGKNRDGTWAGRVATGAELVRNLDLRIIGAGATAESIARTVEADVREHGPSPLYVDYLQLVGMDEKRFHSSYERVSRVSRELKRLAMDYGITVVIVSQLNKGVQRRDHPMPRLEDLRDSAQVAQDATGVLFVVRPDVWARKKIREMQSRGDDKGPEYEKAQGLIDSHTNEVWLSCAKNRYGEMGKARLSFVPETQEFCERAERW